VQTSLSVEVEYHNKFNEILSEAIDKSLNQILGESGTQAIYFYLKEKHHVKREDNLDNLELFQFALEGIFGEGALIIEKTIIENLYSRLSLSNKKFRLKYKNKEQFNFINYINDLKNLNKTTIELHSPKHKVKVVAEPKELLRNIE
jgi:hypothetical protein